MPSMFPELFYTALYFGPLQCNLSAMVPEQAMGYLIDGIDFNWLLDFDVRTCIELSSLSPPGDWVTFRLWPVQPMRHFVVYILTTTSSCGPETVMVTGSIGGRHQPCIQYAAASKSATKQRCRAICQCDRACPSVYISLATSVQNICDVRFGLAQSI